jgi:Fe-Mn family superoxide dismutase
VFLEKGGHMFTLPELPYAYNALEPFIDEMTMKIHHDKHHAAYIKNANDALTGLDAFSQMPVEILLTKLGDLPETIRTKVKNNAGGHYNHSLFWTVMTNSSESGSPSIALGEVIAQSFGSIDEMKEVFSLKALSRFGSGWVWLVIHKGAFEIVDTPNQDSPVSVGKIPILGLDVWEHAYYLKYQNMRADYVKAWWNVVNWKEVSNRYENSRSI